MTHYNDVIMGAMASQITSLTIVYSSVYSADQRKHQSSASLAFVKGIHRWPVNSPHKGPVTRKMFPFDDAVMKYVCLLKRRQIYHNKQTCNSAVICQHLAGLRGIIIRYSLSHISKPFGVRVISLYSSRLFVLNISPKVSTTSVTELIILLPK